MISNLIITPKRTYINCYEIAYSLQKFKQDILSYE